MNSLQRAAFGASRSNWTTKEAILSALALKIESSGRQFKRRNKIKLQISVWDAATRQQDARVG